MRTSNPTTGSIQQGDFVPLFVYLVAFWAKRHINLTNIGKWMEVLLLLCTLHCHFDFILKQKNVIAKKKK
jgi:hypothetical protein